MVDRGTIIASDASSSIIKKSNEVDEETIRKMISKFGPLIYLHPDEVYLMDDPVYVLDNGVTLNWGEVRNDKDYSSLQVKRVRTVKTSSETLKEDAYSVREAIQSLSEPSAYKYWLHIDDRMKKGSMSRAKALVRVLPFDLLTTEIQFWLFYPFNGPGRVEVCASSKMCDDNWLKETGRHYGDWERVSILVSNNAEELLGVYLSRHREGEAFERGDDGKYHSTKDHRKVLHFEGFGRNAHPIIYSAISSHAHYVSPGTHKYERVFSKKYGLGTASADLFDRTDTGPGLRAYHPKGYQFISSAMPNFRVDEPDWLQYDGRWGQYEKLKDNVKFAVKAIKVFTYKEVGNGPTGPKVKKAWNESTFR